MAEATNSPTSAAVNGWAAHYSHSVPKPEPSTGVRCTRLFSKPGISPYSEVAWERRTASISDATGGTIFEQKDVEVPADWSMTATNIVASKYLHGHVGTPQGEFGARETGVRQLVARVAETIRDWGIAGVILPPRKTRLPSTMSWSTCWLPKKQPLTRPSGLTSAASGWNPIQMPRTGIGTPIAAQSSSP